MLNVIGPVLPQVEQLGNTLVTLKDSNALYNNSDIQGSVIFRLATSLYSYYFITARSSSNFSEFFYIVLAKQIKN